MCDSNKKSKMPFTGSVGGIGKGKSFTLCSSGVGRFSSNISLMTTQQEMNDLIQYLNNKKIKHTVDLSANKR